MRVESVRWLSRAALAMIAAALSLCLPALHPAFAADAKLQGLQIVFVEPYGPHSVTNIPLMLMRDEIGRKTGAAVEIRSIATDVVSQTTTAAVGGSAAPAAPAR